MTKYIAFLRGINVGNIRIKMPDLKSAFESWDFREVKTYLQTGNVVFNSDKTILEIKLQLEKGLTETFHYKAHVLLYEFDELAAIIARYPMQRDENHHAYVVFIDNAEMLQELNNTAEEIEKEFDNIKLGNKVLYWKVKKGESLEAPLPTIFAKAKYKSSVTTRNLNTLEKMIVSSHK